MVLQTKVEVSSNVNGIGWWAVPTLQQIKAFGDWRGLLQLYPVLFRFGSILTLGSRESLAAVWPFSRGKR